MLRDALNVSPFDPPSEIIFHAYYNGSQSTIVGPIVPMIDMSNNPWFNLSLHNVNGRLRLHIRMDLNFLANDPPDNIIDTGGETLYCKLFKINDLPDYLFERGSNIAFESISRDKYGPHESSTWTPLLTPDGYLCFSVGTRTVYGEVFKLNTVTYSRRAGFYPKIRDLKKKNLGIFLAKSIHFLIIINQNYIREVNMRYA